MRITKMSLVAALLVGSAAFAIDNTKVSGDANVFYMTQDGGANDFFEAGSSAADISVNLNLTADLVKTDSVAVSAGVGYTAITTLGLEGQMVGNVWGGAHNGVQDASWVNEAWLAAVAGKTTVKVGRMELDTPLAFTETWSIEKNTFDAAAVINQDIADTTLVGAYVGRGNGTGPTTAMGAIVATDGTMSTYGVKGAYALGAINNSWKPLTVQAWFYDVVAFAQATWFQADLDMNGIMAGAQYTTLSAGDTSAYAAMLGYAMKDTVTASVSYSEVDKKGAAGFNTATMGGGVAQSKLYTEAWWNYGQITQAGAKSVHLTVEAPTSIADLGLYVTSVDQVAAGADLMEYTASASKAFGPVDASLVYIHTDMTETATTNNMLQAYLTLNF